MMQILQFCAAFSLNICHALWSSLLYFVSSLSYTTPLISFITIRPLHEVNCFGWWSSKCREQMEWREILCFELLFKISKDYCLNSSLKQSNIKKSNNVRSWISLICRPTTLNLKSGHFVTFDFISLLYTFVFSWMYHQSNLL